MHSPAATIRDVSSDEGIAAFIAARLDEDEAAAETWREHDLRPLREVAAGRALLDLYDRAARYRGQVFAQQPPRSVSDEMRAVTQMMALEQVLKLRAAVYSDHPDYDPDWKP